MKGNMVKVITMILATILCVSLLFGCNTTVGTVIEPTANGQQEEATAVTPEKVEDEIIEEPDDSEWIADIIVKEDGGEDIFGDDFDDSIKYTYDSTTVAFSTVSGGFTTESGSGLFADHTSTTTGSMAVCTSVAFPYGTISVDVKTQTNTDTGIVFGLSCSNKTSFWEGYGVSYYFFFLGQDGTAYLGKTDNGHWTVVKIVDYTFNATDYFNLKVVYKGSAIYCFVNGALMFAVRDSAALTGTGFGIRTGASGVAFKNLTVTNDYVY